jgi:hypothetical protein
MGIDDKLHQAAVKKAMDMQSRLAALDREEAEIDARKAQIHAERNAISRAPDRLANFSVKVGANYQCPHCWIEHERQSVLSPIPSKTSADLFRCDTCHLELEIPF